MIKEGVEVLREFFVGYGREPAERVRPVTPAAAIRNLGAATIGNALHGLRDRHVNRSGRATGCGKLNTHHASNRTGLETTWRERLGMWILSILKVSDRGLVP